MALFQRKLPPESEAVAALRTELSQLAERVRQMEREAESVHADVRKWMRRAVEAERRAEGSRNQEPEGSAEPVAVTPVPAPAARLWGARGRRAARAFANGAEG